MLIDSFRLGRFLCSAYFFLRTAETGCIILFPHCRFSVPALQIFCFRTAENASESLKSPFWGFWAALAGQTPGKRRGAVHSGAPQKTFHALQILCPAAQKTLWRSAGRGTPIALRRASVMIPDLYMYIQEPTFQGVAELTVETFRATLTTSPCHVTFVLLGCLSTKCFFFLFFT